MLDVDLDRLDLDALFLSGGDIVGSVLLLAVLGVLRLVVIRFIRRRTEAGPALQRRWIRSVKNLLLLLLLIGLVLIWAPELRTFALSLTAVAVAVVVATKELILCFSGAFLRAASRAFTVGDWVEIGGVRGEVIDHNIFVTTLLEIEGAPSSLRHTGRRIAVPNSLLLSQPVRNDSGLRDWVFHSFTLTVEPTVNLAAHRAEIERVVERHHAPLRDEAFRRALAERRTGRPGADAAARVRIGTNDVAKPTVTVTLFCPAAATGRLEDAIVGDVTDRLHAPPAQPS